ncbi:phage portal protein [Mycolicibacterium wolinskyi]|uniref:phage portal protein n=1 Tax=Mycolicibacterium wolinskyi TaxID=59750 RepID=UPI003917A6BE
MNIPAPRELGEREKHIAWRLASMLYNRRAPFLLNAQYYEGTQIVPSLGISTPPELETLQAINGWGGSAVDAVSERLGMQGIILNGKSEVDEELLVTFQANNLDSEAPMVHDDSMIQGLGLVVIGVNHNQEPVITGESPLNMAVHVDRATGIVTCGYQTYLDADPASETYARHRATEYLPEKTIHLVAGEGGKWEVVDIDEHPNTAEFGCSVVAFPNRPSTGNRLGAPEIAPAWRSCMDRASRTWVSMEVMREFHIIQKILLLGATEKAFQDNEGNFKSVWETYADFMPAIEPDEEGNVPTVEVVQGQSPDGLLKIIDAEARLMSGYTGLNPQNMGIINTGNPVSGDSIRMADQRLKARTERKAAGYGNSWVRVGRWTYLVRGEDRADLKRAETDWGPTGIPTPATDSDAVSKQEAAGIIPRRSATVQRRLGYSAIERRNMESEFREADGRDLINAVTGAGQPRPDDAPRPGQSADGADDATATA